MGTNQLSQLATKKELYDVLDRVKYWDKSNVYLNNVFSRQDKIEYIIRVFTFKILVTMNQLSWRIFYKYISSLIFLYNLTPFFTRLLFDSTISRKYFKLLWKHESIGSKIREPIG